MRGRGLRAGIRAAMAALLLAVLGVWALFAVQNFNSMAREAEHNAEQMAGHIIDVMEKEFLTLENASFELAHSAVARDFVSTATPLAFHSKAGEVSGYIDSLIGDTHFLDCLILYNSEEQYYRFAGSVSNTSAAKAYYAARPGATPSQLVIPLEGVQHIGYATDIFSGDEAVGKAVLLIEEGRVRTLFNQYGEYGQLDIALAVDGKVVISGNDALAGADAEAMEGRYSGLVSRRVGHTPFEIVVAWQSGYLSSGVLAFALTAAATALIFIVLLAVYTRYTTRHFFTPMLQVMQGVQQLGEGLAALPHYGVPEFDELADTINNMVRRLDERSHALYEARYRLQAAEIDRQKAVITSLKKQISAHFTVNTLSSIRLLSERGETEKASAVCDGLSRLLRYANAGDEFVNGLDEFKTLEDYAGIMQVRYPGRFSIEFDPSDRLGDIHMPRMLVQPVIENAVVHGLGQCTAGGRVQVRGEVEAGQVVITVQDNGAGMAPEALAALRRRLADCVGSRAQPAGLENIALCNIAVRLASYYGGAGHVEVENAPEGGLLVRLRFAGHPNI